MLLVLFALMRVDWLTALEYTYDLDSDLFDNEFAFGSGILAYAGLFQPIFHVSTLGCSPLHAWQGWVLRAVPRLPCPRPTCS